VNRWTTSLTDTFDILCLGAPSGRGIHDLRHAGRRSETEGASERRKAKRRGKVWSFFR
jgi:hypothetical protein